MKCSRSHEQSLSHREQEFSRSHVCVQDRFQKDKSCQYFLPENNEKTHGTTCAAIAAGGDNAECRSVLIADLV